MSKVVLVTGASSGIGKAIAIYLSQKGYKVYGTSRNPQENADVPFSFVKMDVTQDLSVKRGVKAILEKEERIDVLINNAGLGIAGALEDTSIGEAQKVFDTNVFGILRVCNAVLPTMRAHRQGVIINVGSIAGVMGLPFRGIYSASKFAVEGLTEALSMEVKPFGINVCAIQPGGFNTGINDNRLVTKNSKLETSPYKEVFDSVHTIIHEEVAAADSPDEVGKLVNDIIKTKNPDLKYVVGNITEKLSTVVKRILPDRLFEKIILNHHKM